MTELNGQEGIECMVYNLNIRYKHTNTLGRITQRTIKGIFADAPDEYVQLFVNDPVRIPKDIVIKTKEWK